MNTSKPISGISWCSIEYTKQILDTFVSEGKISWWAAIPHMKERDETKDHIHLFVFPSVRISTDDLRTRFHEPTGEIGVYNGCSAVWQKSDFENWYLYGLHDSAYLAERNMDKLYHYKKSDFLTSSKFDFDFLVSNVNPFDIRRKIMESVSCGESWESFVEKYYAKIPLAVFRSCREMFGFLGAANFNSPDAKKGKEKDENED